MFTFYEFFAGGGMARAGLGHAWQCLLANDFDRKKAESYSRNWGDDHLLVDDIRNVKSADLPGNPNLLWGSFPCQDLSLAGGGAGLKGDRSGTFWPFWSIQKRLNNEGRGPQIIVLENVVGTITSHGGNDFATICNALASAGYRYGACVIDAAHFVPQSRPRLFVIAVAAGLEIPSGVFGTQASSVWHPRSLQNAVSGLSTKTRQGWLWWDIPKPHKRNIVLADIIDDEPDGVQWHSQDETNRLLEMMSPVNLTKVQVAQASGVRSVGTLYRRTRYVKGNKVQRAEVRFDDIAGCLRTPAGGSSRQQILLVKGDEIKSRLISARETARLMGLDDTYILPKNYNEAYHLTGDGVVVPVVRHLAANLLEPILNANANKSEHAA